MIFLLLIPEWLVQSPLNLYNTHSPEIYNTNSFLGFIIKWCGLARCLMATPFTRLQTDPDLAALL